MLVMLSISAERDYCPQPAIGVLQAKNLTDLEYSKRLQQYRNSKNGTQNCCCSVQIVQLMPKRLAHDIAKMASKQNKYLAKKSNIYL